MLPYRKRQPPRLHGYDYSRKGLYFITLCCLNRQHLFGEVKDNLVILNDFGKIAARAWTETAIIRPNVGIGPFVIMPDHMHCHY